MQSSLLLNTTYTLAELPKVAQQFVGLLQANNCRVVCLIGDLGAGKTTFVQACANVLGVKESVTSPTFSIVNEYKSPTTAIYHIDLYRLEELQEALDIGIEEYLFDDNAIVFIEWHNLIEVLLADLPASEILYVYIKESGEQEREIKLSYTPDS